MSNSGCSSFRCSGPADSTPNQVLIRCLVPSGSISSFKNGFIKDEGQTIKNRAFDENLKITYIANLIIED